jgi:hypothetical protein
LFVSICSLHLIASLLPQEVLFAVHHEYACTIEDVLARRLRLAFLDPQAAATIVPKVSTQFSSSLLPFCLRTLLSVPVSVRFFSICFSRVARRSCITPGSTCAASLADPIPFSQVAEIMKKELKWSKTQLTEEIKRANDFLRTMQVTTDKAANTVPALILILTHSGLRNCAVGPFFPFMSHGASVNQGFSVGLL